MPRSFLSAFHSPADSTVLPPRLRSLRPPVRPFEARWPAVERDHSSREGRRFKKNSRAGPPTVKRARGAHIVIRGSRLEAERERERERGSWIKNGFGSVLCTADAFRRATTCHGWHTQFARSLARCFCERVLPLPGQPVVRSLAYSLARPSIYAPSSFLPQCSRTGCSEGSRVPRKKPWVYLYERSHKSRRSSSVSRLTLVGYGSRSTGYDPYCRVYPLRGSMYTIH